MSRLEFLEHEVAVAEDGREQVVEVVGDAARQAPDGFHLARLLELILERAARVLHLRPRLEIVQQPLLGTFNLVRHRVKRPRQPANLIAAGPADASRVIALRDGLGGVGQRGQRRRDLPRKHRHQDHGAPHQHCSDEEDPAQEVLGRRHDGLAWKLDPDAPRGVCDLAHRSDAGRVVGRLVDIRPAHAGVDRRRRNQLREIGPHAVAHDAHQHPGPSADEPIEDFGGWRERHRTPDRQVAKRRAAGRARDRLDHLGEDRLLTRLEQPHRPRRRRRRRGRHVGGLVGGRHGEQRLPRGIPQNDHLATRSDERRQPGPHADAGLIGGSLEVGDKHRVGRDASQREHARSGRFGKRSAQLVGGALGAFGAREDEGPLDFAIGGPDKHSQDAGYQRRDKQWQTPPE